jgi:hypothetical protein
MWPPRRFVLELRAVPGGAQSGERRLVFSPHNAAQRFEWEAVERRER